jgi:hypothetical protein
LIKFFKKRRRKKEFFSEEKGTYPSTGLMAMDIGVIICSLISAFLNSPDNVLTEISPGPDAPSTAKAMKIVLEIQSIAISVGRGPPMQKKKK